MSDQRGGTGKAYASMPVLFFCHYDGNAWPVRERVKLEHRLGRKLLRRGLTELYGLNLSAEELEAETQMEVNGKPFLKNFPWISFNISHWKNCVVCALSDRPIGVDGERAESFPEVLIDRVLAEDEKKLLASATDPDVCFFRLWTLKEAYVKWSGVGMDADVRAVSFAPDLALSEGAVPCTDLAVRAWQTVLPEGDVLAVCMARDGEVAEEHFSVTLRDLTGQIL